MQSFRYAIHTLPFYRTKLKAMDQREFISGIARNEQASLEFLRSRSVLESKDEARCSKLVNGVACKSKMNEGQRNGKPSWRCTRDGVRSLKAGNDLR